MLRTSFITSLIAVCMFYANSALAVIIISDTEFQNSDWSTIELRDDGANSTGTGAQQAAGGNPGAYRQGQNILGGPSIVRYAHMYGAATYNPSVQGAISSLDWTYDFIALSVTNPTNGAIASNILIEQGGIYYVAGPGLTLSVNPNSIPPLLPIWTTNSANGLSALNFNAVDSSGNPDFSASGGVISFGWLTSNSTGQQPPGRTATWGLDNWAFTINDEDVIKISIPGTLALLLTGFFALFRSIGKGRR